MKNALASWSDVAGSYVLHAASELFVKHIYTGSNYMRWLIGARAFAWSSYMAEVLMLATTFILFFFFLASKINLHC